MFISAIQRHGAKPTVEHVRRLNKLLRWIQKHPVKLEYKRFASTAPGSGNAEGGGTHLRVVPDAAYKREAEDGYSLRGAVSPAQQVVKRETWEARTLPYTSSTGHASRSDT